MKLDLKLGADQFRFEDSVLARARYEISIGQQDKQAVLTAVLAALAEQYGEPDSGMIDDMAKWTGEENEVSLVLSIEKDSLVDHVAVDIYPPGKTDF